MKKPREFYVLLRGYGAGTAVALNWASHGKSGVYAGMIADGSLEGDPEKGDVVIRVREVLKKKQTRKE